MTENLNMENMIQCSHLQCPLPDSRRSSAVSFKLDENHLGLEMSERRPTIVGYLITRSTRPSVFSRASSVASVDFKQTMNGMKFIVLVIFIFLIFVFVYNWWKEPLLSDTDVMDHFGEAGPHLRRKWFNLRCQNVWQENKEVTFYCVFVSVYLLVNKTL